MHRRIVLLMLWGVTFLAACQAMPQASPREQENRSTGQAPTALVVAIAEEPDTLDAHKTAMAASSDIMSFVGGALVTLDEQGQVVPYLAERWESSADGLTWTFTLKEGITFADGTPFTAQDYVYTIERARDPAIQSPVAGSLLGPVATVQALGTSTLVITLQEPFFPFLRSLAAEGYLMPLSQAVVEGQGEDYGRQPLSVGPYRLQTWLPGEAIRLARNPAFHWGPSYAGADPYPAEQIEFRILPDAATRLAALEVGEVDVVVLDLHQVEHVEKLGRFELYESLLPGAAPMGAFNVSKPPFDDLRVRQAFNLALDREALVQLAAAGKAVVQYGPLSASVSGYWPEVEEIGYRFDLERARALLAEAGYQPAPDGVLEKAGVPLRLPLFVTADQVPIAEVMQAQYRELGAEITIQVVEQGHLFDLLLAGNYQLMLGTVIYPEADILYLLYHSTGASLPVGQLADPILDEMLEKSRSTVDPTERQQWVNRAQERIVQQAYMIPLYTPKVFTAVSPRVQGLRVRADGSLMYEQVHLREEP